MELRPIPESPQEVMVRFDNELEDALFNPSQLRLMARNILERTGLAVPRQYPYTNVYSLSALRRRGSAVHSDNCPFMNEFSPVVLPLRQQNHEWVMNFEEQLRGIEQANWPAYER